MIIKEQLNRIKYIPSCHLNTVLVLADLSNMGGGMDAPLVGGGRVVPLVEYTE